MTKKEVLNQPKEVQTTKKELEKQKKELKKQIKELKKQTEELEKQTEEISNNIEELPRFNRLEINKNNIDKIIARAMQIEQAIRIRRIELNGGWEPDWDDIYEGKYYVYITVGGRLTVYKEFLRNFLPVWGYYKSKEIAKQIIDEFNDDLLWYFTEYAPNIDRIYMYKEGE